MSARLGNITILLRPSHKRLVWFWLKQVRICLRLLKGIAAVQVHGWWKEQVSVQCRIFRRVQLFWLHGLGLDILRWLVAYRIWLFQLRIWLRFQRNQFVLQPTCRWNSRTRVQLGTRSSGPINHFFSYV